MRSRFCKIPAPLTVVALLFGAAASAADITYLSNDDFRWGTYVIDRPGVYRLAEDISFNPNSPAALTAAIASGELDVGVAAAAGLPLPPQPVDAYHAGMPLFSQFVSGGASAFSPGGPADPRYDPAAFGLGFFAAIVIKADNVVLDLNGRTIEQSREHALLQRFFAVIELADRPFVPGHGPADFGADLDAARHVVIRNGTIGRSAHHGIHGNANRNVSIVDVDFVDYEVAAVALNGVNGLLIRNVSASNREDVPVLGTFSAARFIRPYVDELYRRGATTTLRVGGVALDVAAVRGALREAVNAVHHDLIDAPNLVDGRARIDAARHPALFALFANPYGLVDGNSYSFLVNHLGVAVNGFPYRPDGAARIPSENVRLYDVRVDRQWAFVNEVIALNDNDKAVVDPVGAVFQVLNRDLVSGRPVTVTALDPRTARYTGNVVSNAQALVAKAFHDGAFAGSRLDFSRLTISEDVIDWIEGRVPSLAALLPTEADFFCNGDSMFHVNKGLIAFKMDAAYNVRLSRTRVGDARNFGFPGSPLCGDYAHSVSHPLATLPGYGGAFARAYTFAGSRDVRLSASRADRVVAAEGSAVGVDVLTDSRNVLLSDVVVGSATAGRLDGGVYAPPNAVPAAVGFRIGAETRDVRVQHGCVGELSAPGAVSDVDDDSGAAHYQPCR